MGCGCEFFFFFSLSSSRISLGFNTGFVVVGCRMWMVGSRQLDMALRVCIYLWERVYTSGLVMRIRVRQLFVAGRDVIGDGEVMLRICSCLPAMQSLVYVRQSTGSLREIRIRMLETMTMTASVAMVLAWLWLSADPTISEW